MVQTFFRKLLFTRVSEAADLAVLWPLVLLLRNDQLRRHLRLPDGLKRLFGQRSPRFGQVEKLFLRREQFFDAFIRDYPVHRNARLLGRGLRFAAYCLVRHACARLEQGRQGADTPRPSSILYSPTSGCNLACDGCYTASAHHDESASLAKMRLVADEATDIGAENLIIVGHGEPFLTESSSARFFSLFKQYPWLNFIIYTNGTRVDRALAQQLARHLNLLLLVSLDGPERENDARRGQGVWRDVMRAMDCLKACHVPFGFAATVTRDNYRALLEPSFINEVARRGSLAGIYCVYAPVDSACSPQLMLTTSELAWYRDRMGTINRHVRIPVIDPEIFELSAGCSAKRGRTVHVDGISGQINPCVKYPLGPRDAVLRGPGDLRAALEHPFFCSFRQALGDNERCPNRPQREISELCQALCTDDPQHRRGQAYLRRINAREEAQTHTS